MDSLIIFFRDSFWSSQNSSGDSFLEFLKPSCRKYIRKISTQIPLGKSLHRILQIFLQRFFQKFVHGFLLCNPSKIPSPINPGNLSSFIHQFIQIILLRFIQVFLQRLLQGLFPENLYRDSYIDIPSNFLRIFSKNYFKKSLHSFSKSCSGIHPKTPARIFLWIFQGIFQGYNQGFLN